LSYSQGANASYLPPPLPPPAPPQQLGGVTQWNDQGVLGHNFTGAGESALLIVHAQWSREHAQQLLATEFDSLKQNYTFSSDRAITAFLTDHRLIRSMLREAVPKLRHFFGRHTSFNLELSLDEDSSRTLYVVAIWPDAASGAAQALDKFVEDWWLDKMSPATSELAFVYKLV
jgi:hypothetical protein